MTGTQMDWQLSGRAALITGATGGLGAAFARYLAKEGATVVLCGRREEVLKALADDIISGGGKAHSLTMDLRSLSSVARAVENAESLAGPLDILVNNAAVAPVDSAFDQNIESWDEVTAVNFRGPWFLSAEAARRMRRSDRTGAIVNVGSTAALSPSPYMAGYGATKAALIHLTRSLAAEFSAFGIRVNAIVPGIFNAGMALNFADTPRGQAILRRVPLARFGTPEDLRIPLLWLCSPLSSYVTGTCVVIDGGLSGVGAC